MKKLFSILIVMQLLVSLQFKSSVLAAKDTTPPILKSVSVNQKIAKTGDSLIFTVDAEELESDINFVQIDLVTPGTGKIEGFLLEENGDGKIVGTYTIKSIHNNGEWKIKGITLYNQAGLYKEYTNKEIIENGDFIVEGNNYDIEPPELISVNVSRKITKVGNTQNFNIEVEDGGSGPHYATIEYISPKADEIEKLNTSNSNFYFDNKRPSRLNLWATKEIEKTTVDGDWKLKRITIYDYAGNKKIIENEMILENGNYFVKKNYFDENSENGGEDNLSIEQPMSESVTTEKPTTEKPTTERPTTEQPTTEKPSVQVPTTEVVSTEKPTIEKLQSIVVSKPVISNKYIGDNTSIITGKAKSYSTVYALVNKKVIGSAKVKNGKFTMKIAKQTAGTKISFYTNYKKKKSSTATYTIADKTAPTYPIVNKVTYKSKVVTGKGEKSSKVYVYNGKKKIGYSVVDSKGNYKVKISAQKQKTILTVYLVDKDGNKGKAKSIKVS